jgi:DNA repair exonuclease SbcCD nuclease subunit
MKAFIVGDLQASIWGQQVTPDGVNRRLMDLIDQLYRIRNLANERSVRWIFIVGDIFEERGKLDVVVLTLLLRCLWSYKKFGINVVLLVGNHDRIPAGEFHALEILRRSVAFVIDKPTMLMCDKVNVLALPYDPESRHIAKSLKRHRKDAELILMHVAVKGVRLPSGERWAEGIRLKHIPKKPVVLMGHDHHHKQLRKKVWYVGSLLQLDWGDTGVDKVFAEYNSKTKRIKWHPSQGPKFIRYGVKKSKKIVVTLLKNPKKLRKKFSGNFVRFHYDGPTELAGKLKLAVLKKCEARTVELEQTPLATHAAANASKGERLHQMMKKVVASAEESDRGSLLELGSSILSEAMHESRLQKT